jgi:preprotein translocase subunit SecY
MAFIGGGGTGDKQLRLGLMETLRLAMADPDLRARLTFVLLMFGVYAFGTHVPVPIPGVNSESVWESLKKLPQADLINIFGGGGLKRLSILALSLAPYITASIIIQVLTTALPNWKKELQEGGEHGRRVQNQRTRYLTLALCVGQGLGLLTMIGRASPEVMALPTGSKALVVLFWTAGAMFTLWLGEQISERGIGNGVSLMIFAGILISLPDQIGRISIGIKDGLIQWWQVVLLLIIFSVSTYFVVYFTNAQRRIPIQHMRRQVGTKVMGGQTSYLPLSLNMVGVIPIIFASSLIYIPSQLAIAFGPNTGIGKFLEGVQSWMNPMANGAQMVVGYVAYTVLIFFFTYFYTAVQYNVDDIANNLKKGGSFIPGIRPGKQTRDYLDGVISRVTFVGASFLTVVALTQYVSPRLTGIPISYLSVVGGTTLLIVISVALETIRQIEANLLMKQYGN